MTSSERCEACFQFEREMGVPESELKTLEGPGVDLHHALISSLEAGKDYWAGAFGEVSVQLQKAVELLRDLAPDARFSSTVVVRQSWWLRRQDLLVSLQSEPSTQSLNGTNRLKTRTVSLDRVTSIRKSEGRAPKAEDTKP